MRDENGCIFLAKPSVPRNDNFHSTRETNYPGVVTHYTAPLVIAYAHVRLLSADQPVNGNKGCTEPYLQRNGEAIFREGEGTG